jgi:hypothetical protein
MNKDWEIWLNINPFIASNYENKHIGKNIIFNGDSKYLFISDNIYLIGYGKIYNESHLWEIIKSKEDVQSVSQYSGNGINILKTEHNLQIIVELYKLYGFQDTLELLEGDFSFVLLDFNLYGEESWLYVARDPFGLYPLYYYENPNNHTKKVQFEMEMKQYSFSSNGYSKIYDYKPFLAGNYQRFSHSFKVSALWKHNDRPIIFYKTPFFSIYDQEENTKLIGYQMKQIELAIEKRIKWIHYKYSNVNVPKEKIKLAIISLDSTKHMENLSLRTYLENNNTVQNLCDLVQITPFNVHNSDNSLIFELSKIISLNSKEEEEKDVNYKIQIEYIEKEYPTIITKLKHLLNSNDPYIIRCHFIPMIIAKYLSENMPEIKHVFLGEYFTYNWIEKGYLDRNKKIRDLYLNENIKAWTQIFIEYDIELYMPFIDRILIQNIKPLHLL